MHIFDVGVIVVKRQSQAGFWSEHVWLPYGVLPAIPMTEPGTKLGGDADDAFFYAGAAQLILHCSATSHYRDNINAERPSLWVALRLTGDDYEVVSVTADPYEGEASTEGFGNIVEAVPMPDEICSEIAAFIDAFHVERPFIKRQRDRAQPDRPRARTEHRP